MVGSGALRPCWVWAFQGGDCPRNVPLASNGDDSRRAAFLEYQFALMAITPDAFDDEFLRLSCLFMPFFVIYWTHSLCEFGQVARGCGQRGT